MFRFQKKVSGVGGQTLKNQRSQRVNINRDFSKGIYTNNILG